MKIRFNFKDNTSIEQVVPNDENAIGEVFKLMTKGINNNGNVTVNAENLNKTIEKKYSDVFSIELVLN